MKMRNYPKEIAIFIAMVLMVLAVSGTLLVTLTYFA